MVDSDGLPIWDTTRKGTKNQNNHDGWHHPDGFLPGQAVRLQRLQQVNGSPAIPGENCYISANPGKDGYRQYEQINCYKNDALQDPYPFGTCQSQIANLAESAGIRDRDKNKDSFLEELRKAYDRGDVPDWESMHGPGASMFSHFKERDGSPFDSFHNRQYWQPQVAVLTNPMDRDAPLPANSILGSDFN